MGFFLVSRRPFVTENGAGLESQGSAVQEIRGFLGWPVWGFGGGLPSCLRGEDGGFWGSRVGSSLVSGGVEEFSDFDEFSEERSSSF